jgi:hypothetical protein
MTFLAPGTSHGTHSNQEHNHYISPNNSSADFFVVCMVFKWEISSITADRSYIVSSEDESFTMFCFAKYSEIFFDA